MEIMEALSLARQSVEEADLPSEWCERAFGEVLRSLLSGRTAPVPQTQADETREAATKGGSSLDRLAVRLGVSEFALADVFAIEDGAVSLHVSSSRISVAKSRATKEISLLMVAARQGAGIDESWTEVAHVRDALTQYNRYDTSNFSKYLRDTGDVFNFRGKPVQLLRLTRQGWEAATELVRTLTASAI